MARLFALLVLSLLPVSVIADTIRHARVLSDSEIEEVPEKLESRWTSISQAQKSVIEETLGQENSVSSKEALEALTKQDPDKMPVMDLTRAFGDLPIAKAFMDHPDPVIRFLANVYLLKSGQLDASERLKAMMDDDTLDEFDSRYLKTRFAAIGIDVQNATAADIAKHFSLLAREFPVLSIGDDVPDAQFSDINGRKLSISDFRGKTLIIHYWATWCGPCMDELDSLAQRLNAIDKDKYAIVFVSLDVDLDSHAKRLKSLPQDFVFVCDCQSARGPLTSIFSVIHIPVNVIISPEGKLHSTKLSDVLPNDSPPKAP